MHAALSGMSSYTTWQCSSSQVAQDTRHTWLTGGWWADVHKHHGHVCRHQKRAHMVLFDSPSAPPLSVTQGLSVCSSCSNTSPTYSLYPQLLMIIDQRSHCVIVVPIVICFVWFWIKFYYNEEKITLWKVKSFSRFSVRLDLHLHGHCVKWWYIKTLFIT